MTESHKTTVANLVELIKEWSAKDSHGQDWQPITAVMALIPDQMAKAHLATLHELSIKDANDPVRVARLFLARDAIKALEDSGMCEVRGEKGNEEICWVLPANATATKAAPPASTKSNKSDMNASQATTQRNTQNVGENGSVLKGNNESATPNDPTDDDEPAAIDVQADADNTVIVAEPTDKMSGAGVVKMPFEPILTSDNKTTDDGVAEMPFEPILTSDNKTTDDGVAEMPFEPILTSNNESATPNDTTDEAAADNSVTVAEPTDNKTADDGMPEPPSRPVTKPLPATDTTGTTTSRNRTMKTKRNAPQPATEAQEEDVTAAPSPSDKAPGAPASEHDAESHNSEHPDGDNKTTPVTLKRQPRSAAKQKTGRRAPLGPSDPPAEGGPSSEPGDGELREVPLDDLVIDPELQARVKINEDVVQEYAEAMGRGDKFPPVRAVDDGKQLWPWDYVHRLLAARKSGAKTIAVRVTKGTREDALWFAACANQCHGLRLSTADKQRAFKMIQAHPRSKGLSMRAIAKIAGISPQTASNYIKAQKGGKRVSNFDTKTARRANEDDSQTPPKQQGPAETAESTSQAGQSPPARHDDTKKPMAPAGPRAEAEPPERDEPRDSTPEQQDGKSPESHGLREERRQASSSLTEENDQLEVVLGGLQTFHQFLKKLTESFAGLVKLLDEDQREDLRNLVVDIYDYANRMIVALDNPKLWRREEEDPS